MQVGGDIQGGKIDGTTQAMIGGTIQHGGTCLSVTPSSPFTSTKCGSWYTNGVGQFQQAWLNPQPWLDLFGELQNKSAYWAGLTPNGHVNINPIGPAFSTVTLERGDDECIQIFFLPQAALLTPSELIISPSLAGKTILINVELDSQGNVVIDNFTNIIDTTGTSGNYFNSETKQAMIWNFGKAASVTLGNSDGGSQFPGSVLIPHGNLRMQLPGQDGRTIVFGDVFHNAPGSEFHNYEFDPPCALCVKIS
jgi:choice-of-anchor A domain-containing protein